MTTISKTHLLSRMIAYVIVGFSLGWLFGEPFLGLCVVMGGYFVWSFRQLFKLLDWLNDPKARSKEPPESKGFWGQIFDGIYRLQKQHSRSRQKLAGVIERVQESTAALNDGVVMIDNQSNLEWWNPAAGTLIGLKTPDDQGQLITNLLRDPRFVDYFEQGGYQKALEIPSPINPDHQLQFNITVYGKGNRLMTVRDVTRLNQLEVMRKDFVANVSHELRTPLTVVSGYIETMLDSLGPDSGLPPVWEKALNRMQEQSLRMQNLVADLLLLSKLESAEAQADENGVHVKTLLSSIVEDGCALSGESRHQISLDCPEDVFLAGSSNELRSAFSNLVFNAVRYTPEGGKILVRWWQDGEGGHMMVEDNGVGIDPMHIPRLTERFYRIDKSRSQNTGGTGLGLAIVKHVMLRHGGKLTISSHPGKGSRFICHFPEKCLELEHS
ncbi:phosphate regulon sensor histidine kinase PhoR [Endozoicomonas sp. ALD040]|uniref:phosphate regulon sensor histidine kinase PhoR n=1 Tax=Endozoicomonas sp. ALD040 TaxID=3403079 RepID=UPI003BB108B5